MKAVVLMTVLAGAGFSVLFSPWTKGMVPFFPAMTGMAFSLAVVSLVTDRREMKAVCRFKPVHLGTGLLAAAFLYAVFWIGHVVSTHVLPFAAGQVDAIYTIRSGQNRWVIAGLLFFIIGPAEEIFWRGYIQRRLSKRCGLLAGLIIAAAVYTLVHVWSLNLMLLAAAAVCGGFWGLLFAVTGNLWPGIISHAVWDVMIFILWPIT